MIAQTIFSYLMAALVLPDFPPSGAADMKASHLPVRLNFGFHIFWIVISAVAAFTQREWFHEALVLVAFVVNVLYIALLFLRLQIVADLAAQLVRHRRAPAQQRTMTLS